MLILSKTSVKYPSLHGIPLSVLPKARFSRSYNRDRHEKQGCWKHLEKEPKPERLTITMTAAINELVSKAESDKGRFRFSPQNITILS